MQPLHSSPPLIAQPDDAAHHEDRVVRCAGCNGYLNPHVRFEVNLLKLLKLLKLLTGYLNPHVRFEVNLLKLLTLTGI